MKFEVGDKSFYAKLCSRARIFVSSSSVAEVILKRSLINPWIRVSMKLLSPMIISPLLTSESFFPICSAIFGIPPKFPISPFVRYIAVSPACISMAALCSPFLRVISSDRIFLCPLSVANVSSSLVVKWFLSLVLYLLIMVFSLMILRNNWSALSCATFWCVVLCPCFISSHVL